MVVTTVGYAIAFAMEMRNSIHANDSYSDLGGDNYKVKDPSSFGIILFGAVAMLLWGFSDSFVQALSYWQLKVWFPESAASSRAVGFYRLVSSAGWCIGFALSPPARVAPVWQLIISALCYSSGFFLVEPPSQAGIGDISIQ